MSARAVYSQAECRVEEAVMSGEFVCDKDACAVMFPRLARVLWHRAIGLNPKREIWLRRHPVNGDMDKSGRHRRWAYIIPPAGISQGSSLNEAVTTGSACAPADPPSGTPAAPQRARDIIASFFLPAAVGGLQLRNHQLVHWTVGTTQP